MDNTGKKYVGSEVANKDIGSEASRDPNEIIGLEGYNAPESTDTLRWVSATQTLAYTVYFENDADFATAAASKVTINVPLHPKLNYATLGIGSFGFGSHVFAVEGSPSSYQTRIDLRDSMGIYLDVVAGLDIVHNEAFWIFQSIDPATGLPPTAINMGFLPINDSLHSGEGFVSFTVKSKANECVTGDTVTATASIVFDVNEAIPTNTWLHTVDAFPPTSTLTITPNAAGDMLAATFAGEDDEGGCGIKQYKLYYSVNGSSYQLYDVYPVGDTAEIPVETGMEYAFFTLAEDNVGNCETMKIQPEYNIGTNFVTLAVNAFPQEAGTVTGSGTYSVNDTAQLTATVAEGYHFVNWMSQGVPVSTENPYSAVVSQNQTYTAYFERNAYTLQTLAAVGSSITVVDLNGNEVPSGSTVLHFDQLIVSTDTAKCYTMSGLLLNGEAFVSGDTLTVTGDITLSTTTESLLTQTDTTATACDSFVWYGETLTETAEYTKTFTNTIGCDSVVTLHLTLKHSVAELVEATACDSYTWNTTTYTQSGDYVQTFTAANGCDSVVTLHLTVNHGTYTETTVDTCGTQYYWALADTIVTHSGSYYHYSANTSTCIDTTVLILSLYQSATTEISAQICAGEVYDQNGFNVSAAGDHQLNMQTIHGCDSTVVLHLTVGSEAVTYLAASICEGESYQENGFDIIVPSVGTYMYSDTIERTGTCDSIVHLALTVNYGTYAETTVDTCGTEYYWALADTTVNQSGTYYYYSTNDNTCTDTAVLMLALYQSATTELSAQICAGEVYDQNGFNVSTAGDHYLNLQTEHGCDSTVVLHLTVGSEAVTYLAASICAGDSYHENGFEIIAPSVGTHMYSDTIERTGTCDSIVHLTLTVNRGTYTETTVDTCGTEYYWALADTTVNQSGTYYYYSTNASTCTDTTVLMLSLYQSATTELSAQICAGEVYDQNGFNVGTAGDHYLNLQTEHGCDSTVILHLTVGSEAVSYLAASICEGDSYQENGFEIIAPSVGTHMYSDTIGRTGTCDSIVHLTLTVNRGNYTETTVDTCGTEYYWALADTTVNQSGSYYYYSTNANTCIDTAVLMLSLYQSATTELAAQICGGEVYDQNGFNVGTAGDHYLNLQTAHGCDSIVHLTLTVNHGTYAETTVDTCAAEYYWALADTTLNQSGTYYYYSPNTNTCTDTAVLMLVLYQSAMTELSAQICAGEVYDQNGFNVSTAGDHYLNLQTEHGCDSTVILHLAMGSETVTYLTASICKGDSYQENGFEIIAPSVGTHMYSDTIGRPGTCDSIVHLALTVNHGTYTETTVDTCGTEYYWALADTTVNQSGTYYYYSTNTNTCTDTTVLILSLYQSAMTELSAQICAGEVYDQNGFNASTAGDHYLNLQTAHGCDSIVHLTLTVNRGTYAETTVDTCGTEYYWALADTTVNQSGTYYYYSTNANTCTDTAVLMIALYQSATTELTAQICAGEVYDQNGFNASTAGDHYLNLQTAHGCDSTVILHLTVGNEAVTYLAASICEGDSYHENGFEIIAPSVGTHIYSDTIGRVGTCDSIVHLTLTVNRGTYTETAVDTCGTEYYWALANTTVNQSGTYYYYSPNTNTCTDTTVLILSLYQSATTELTASICEGEVYDQNGFNVSTAGDHYLNLQTEHGCDSTVILHLTVGSEAVTYLAASICEGDSYQENGFEIIAPATGTHMYSDTIGRTGTCDSIVHLTLTVNRGNYTETTVDTCGTEYYWALADTTVNQSGSYYYYSTNANTCIDTEVLMLSLYQSATTELAAQICGGEVYDQNGFNASTAGDHYLNLQTAHGCDSTVILHLTVGNEAVTYLAASICEGDSYQENGFNIIAPSVGTHMYSDTIARLGTCDSVISLTLTVNAATSGDTTAVVNSSFDWYGQHLTTSGDYTSTLTNAAGCDSVVTLHLTVNHPVVTGDTTAIACDRFDWYEHTNLTQSGDYVHTFTNIAGGDSVVTLHLTINHSVTEIVEATACDSYTWNGITYTQSVNYTQTFTNASGCDSTITLHLTIYPTVTEIVEATACDSYTWNGTTYTQSGDYTQTFTNANGCDSVVTLHLTFVESPVLQTITGEQEICINQYATYHYDISDPNYQYRWLKDNVLWGENVPVMTLHEMGEGVVLVTMQVTDGQSGCAADTSMSVHVANRIAPDTTEVRRKGSSNILVCKPVYSDYGQVHYRWGYTDLSTSAEVVIPGDRNYCLYDIGIDTFSYRYWVETYLNESVGAGCENRSYYAYDYITTFTPGYGGNIVDAYLSGGRIMLNVSAFSPEDVAIALYDMNGKLLLTKGYGVTELVSDVIPVSFAPGIYLLNVNVGGHMYSFKLLKM